MSTGVAGSIGLFLRKGWTIATFAICLVAVIVQMVYTMLIGGGLQVMGPSGLVMPSLVIGFAAAFLWFSWFARSRGWFDTLARHSNMSNAAAFVASEAPQQSGKSWRGGIRRKCYATTVRTTYGSPPKCPLIDRGTSHREARRLG